MPMFLQGQAPRRAPFSDWCAQVCRTIERQTGCPQSRWHNPPSDTYLRSCYDVGLTIQETADDFS